MKRIPGIADKNNLSIQIKINVKMITYAIYLTPRHVITHVNFNNTFNIEVYQLTIFF